MRPPRRALVYVFGAHCFVRHPASRGMWMRTDVCVAKVACPVCHQQVGVPCVFASGYCQGTHYMRRNAAKRVGFPSSSQITFIAGGGIQAVDAMFTEDQ